MEALRRDVRLFFPKYANDKSIFDMLARIYKYTKNYILLPDIAHVRFSFSSRMVKKAGSFSYKLKAGKSGNSEYTMQITLSRALLFEKELDFRRAQATYQHELIHLSNLYGYVHSYNDLDSHGPEFEKKAAILNAVFKLDPPITKFHNYEVPYRYALQCSKCGANIRKVMKKGVLTRKKYHKNCLGLLEYKELADKDIIYE